MATSACVGSLTSVQPFSCDRVGGDAVQIHTRSPPAQREQAVSVLQQHERATLSLESGGAECRGADSPRRFAGIDERVLEEAQRELLLHDALRRAVHARLGQFAGTDRLDDQVRALRSAELIHTRLYRPDEPRSHWHVFDAPGHAEIGPGGPLPGGRSLTTPLRTVVGDRPIGEDYAPEAVPPAEHSRQHLRVERGPDCLDRRAHPSVAPSRIEYVGITPATLASNAPRNGRT